MNQFCEMKGILRQFSVARTPQQNGVAGRRNRTLIEAARIMLADFKLPTTFWAETVNTACYVHNRVLVVKPHNKTPYELFHGRTTTLSFMRPFRCPVTILNTIDHLGKFDGKADEGFFVGYSLNSKAFRVFNSRTRIVEENLHIRFSESTPNVAGSGPDWLFDIDALTRTMNYEPIIAGTQSNGFTGAKASDNAGQARKETEPVKDYILLPLWTVDPPFSQDLKISHDDGSKPSSDDGKKVDEDLRKDSESNDQEKEDNVNSTNNVNAASTNEVNVVGGKTSIKLLDDPNIPDLEDISIFDFSRSDKDDDAEADINNLDTTIQISPNPTTRIHKDHPFDQVIRDFQSDTQTRRMIKNLEEHRTQKGFTQEEGINYDEVFAPVSRIETIRLFLAYASFKDFMVYQMDVKSAFLYGKIEEEVYVCQPPGFKDPDFPDRLYKVEKALYGLHQAPRAWYETLSTYLLDNKFQRGKIDKNLFIKRYKGDILLVRQKKDGIFISQDKYVGEILKKFGFTEVKTASTLKETQKPLLKDEDGEEVDVHMYRLMIGSLMYLTSLRPDIMFAVCTCARYHVNPKVSHLYAMKRIFRTVVNFWGSRLISWPVQETDTGCKFTTEAEYVAACFKVALQALVDEKKIIITESTVRRDLQLEDAEGVDCLPNDTIFEQLTLMSSKTTAWNKFNSTMASSIICLATNQKFNFSKYIFESMVKNLDNVGKNLMYPRHVADEAVNEEIDDILERAATTATSLDAEQDRGNINKTQSKATPNKASSQGTTSGGGPRRQETMGDTISQIRFENVSKTSNDLLLARGNTLRSGEDSLKLNELMELCTNLQQMVLDLETTKTTKANEIACLKRRVMKLERRNKSRTHGLKRMYRGRRINAIDYDEDITLVNVHTDEDMFDVNDLDGDEVIVDNVSTILVSAATTTTTTTAIITDVEVTLAQALAELKSVKPKAVKIVIQEPEQGTTTTTPTTIIFVPKPSHDKGKGIMIEEPMVEQLQAKEEEERLAREKAHQTEEANIAWDDVQTKIKVDYQLAQRLQAQEQEELIDEEKARLFVQFLEQRRKTFTAKREEEKRNKPPTRAQQRSIMSMKRENTFVDYRTELVEEKLQSLIEVVSNDEEEVAIDVVPLATKPPTIVDWKIYKEGKKSYYQIIRADGKSQMYRVFSQMLKSFSREDLEDLYKLVKAKYGSTRAVEDLDLILWGDLKTMFEPIKRLLDDLRVTAAKLMLLVYKLLLLVLKVNATSTKVTTAERVSTVRERIKTEERIKIVRRSRLLK
ncbi:retrovirus-related pol polyprotein from transposon TNT 1-94 [Tanacetum coccineum]